MKIENLFVTWQQRSAQSNMPISVSTPRHSSESNLLPLYAEEMLLVFNGSMNSSNHVPLWKCSAEGQ